MGTGRIFISEDKTLVMLINKNTADLYRSAVPFLSFFFIINYIGNAFIFQHFI